VAAILIFFPGRNRPRLETSAETGRGMAQGGRKLLLRGGRSRGRASVVGWRGTCRGVGRTFPCTAFPPWGKRERGSDSTSQAVECGADCRHTAALLCCFNHGNSLISFADKYFYLPGTGMGCSLAPGPNIVLRRLTLTKFSNLVRSSSNVIAIPAMQEPVIATI
jgi:hypothetical protein